MTTGTLIPVITESPLSTHYFFPFGATVTIGPGPYNVEATRSHSDTSHSVGLLWTSNQPDTDT
jgi:hypothetical protein